MAKRGRKETPTELKILKGTRKDRVNRSAPVAIKARPACPGHLAGEAAEMWGEMVGYLEQLGVLSLADSPALEIFATVYARWRKANQELAPSVTASTAEGGDKSHPAAAVAAAAEDKLLKLLSEFGMTPSARSRLKAERPAPKADRLGEFLAKRRRG